MSENPLLWIFEDSDADALLLRLGLDSHLKRYEFVRIDDGDEAMEAIGRCADGLAQPPDIFVIDINLPKRSGLEILSGIKQIPSLRSTPAVVLTSSESPRDKLRAEELGVTAFLKKPLGLEEFLSIGGVLKKCLEAG